MSGTSSSDDEKSMEQSNEDLSKVMDQLSVSTDNSRKNPPSLSDMPIDVVEVIIEKLDYRQHLKLRKVSKSLRSLVDKQKPACKSIKVDCCAKKVYIKFNAHTVTYSKNVVNSVRFNENADTSINIARDDFKKVAFDDLASTLKNPKLQLEEFSVLFCLAYEKEEEIYRNVIRSVLKSLNHQVSVKEIKLDMRSPSNSLSVLPYLKPGVLEGIWIDVLGNEVDWSGDSNGMDKVALLEQWKQAKQLELWSCFYRFPMKYATHFKRFLMSEYVINTNTFDRIKKFLSKLEDFEYCRITHYWLDNIEDVQRMIGTPVPPNMSHHSIADSDACLEFSFALDGVTIVKKKCRLH